MAYKSIFANKTAPTTKGGYVSIFKKEEAPVKETTSNKIISEMLASGQATTEPIGSLPAKEKTGFFEPTTKTRIRDVGREAFNILAKPFKYAIKQTKDELAKTPEDYAEEKAMENYAGYNGKKKQTEEAEKVEAGTSVLTYEKILEFRKGTEAVTEKVAKTAVIPVRYTAGELAKAMTSVSLEKADSDLKFDPRTDTEKLLVGEDRIQRLTEQEDLYGMIARGVGIPAALIAMTLIENPFIKSIGIGSSIKKALYKKLTKEFDQQVIKIGAEELARMADDVIKAEQKAGKITEKEAIKATEEIAKMKKTKPPIEKVSEKKPIEKVGKAKESITEEISKAKAEGKSFDNGADFYQRMSRESRDTLRDKGVYYEREVKEWFDKNIGKKGGALEGVMQHRPSKSGVASNIPQDSLPDFYEQPRLYTFGGKEYDESVKVLMDIRNKPNKEITIYRAGPKNELRTGDWIALSKEKARLESLSENVLVQQFKVKVKDIQFAGDDITEFGYWGSKIEDKSQLKQLWDKGGKVKKPKKPPIRYIPEDKVDLRGKVTTEPTISVPKVSKRISDETIEKGLVDNFGDIPDRDIVRFKDQAKLVGEIIDNNPKEAIDIALGKSLPRNGALPESVFIAVKNQAIKNGDTGLLRELATTPGGVASEASTLGARIKMLDEGMKDDAFKRLNKLVKDRKKKFEKRGKSVAKSKKAEVKNIKETIKKPDRYDWDNFINSIKC